MYFTIKGTNFIKFNTATCFSLHLFHIRELIIFVYSIPIRTLVTLNVKTVYCYTVKIIKK